MRIGIFLFSLLLLGCKATEVKDVLIIGDSVSVSSAGRVIEIGSDVDANSGVNRILFTVLATGGIAAQTKARDGTEYWGKVLPNIVDDGKYDAIVVALGINDCEGTFTDSLKSYGDYIPHAQNIVSAIRSKDASAQIFWLTTQMPAPCGDIINNDIATIVPTLPYKEWALAHTGCYWDAGKHLKPTWEPELYLSGLGPKEKPAGYCDGDTEYAKWLKAQLDNHFITL